MHKHFIAVDFSQRNKWDKEVGFSHMTLRFLAIANSGIPDIPLTKVNGNEFLEHNKVLDFLES